MAAAFAFLGMWLVSLVVGLLAALQLGDFFRAGDEFLPVIAVIAGFDTAVAAIFIAGYALAAPVHVLNGIAVALAVAASVLVLQPPTVSWIAVHSNNPYTVGSENVTIVLELLVPALLIVLVQWGLVRRRSLRAAGEDDLTRWPWLTTVVAGFVILNPIGLAFVWSALRQSAGDWLKDFATMVSTAGVCVLVVMGSIECYIRGRMLRRRLERPPP